MSNDPLTELDDAIEDGIPADMKRQLADQSRDIAAEVLAEAWTRWPARSSWVYRSELKMLEAGLYARAKVIAARLKGTPSEILEECARVNRAVAALNLSATREA